jgi:Protein of unknown function (DUF3617)
MSRFRSLLAISVLFAAFTARVHAQAAPPAGAAVMLPGLWEITIQTRSPILAAPVSHTVCIDKTQVTKPEPPKSKPKDDCQVLPDAAAANQTAYTVRCTKRKSSSTSRFTYSGDHFDGTVTTTLPEGEFQQVYTAVRIGDCDLPDVPANPPAH